jgi:hypothetical protein
MLIIYIYTLLFYITLDYGDLSHVVTGVRWTIWCFKMYIVVTIDGLMMTGMVETRCHF